MKKLLCTLPDPGGCVDWWRAIVPFVHLEEGDPDFDVDFYGFGEGYPCSWVRAMRSSAVFAPYPYRPEIHQMFNLAEMAGKPVWVDIDDHYWGIEDTNYARMHFDDRGQELLKRAISLASVVTVSTEPLKEVVERFKIRAVTVVVKNAIPDNYVYPNTKRQKLVVYRGSYKTHAADLFSVADDLRAVIKENPDWTFRFYGGHPIFVHEENVQFVDSSAIPHFHKMLYESGASILINPLTFSHFNECKSNISWIESGLAGAAFLGPDLPSFREPGASVYKPGKFGQRLRDLIAMTDLERGQLVQRSQKAIDEKYRLSVVNPIRSQIMREL